MPIEAAGAWKRERREPASWTSGGGGPPGRGDTGPSQAAIDSARRVNEKAEEVRAIKNQLPRDRNIGGKGPLPVLENLGSSNLEKLMSMRDPAGLSYNFLNMLDNAYNDPGWRKEYGSKYDPYARSERTGQLVYHNAEIGEPGAVLVDGEWKKPVLSGLGEYLHEQATTGTRDEQGRFTMDAFLGTEKGKDMFTGIPTTLLPQNIPAITSQLDKALSYIGGGGYGGGGGGSWGGGWGGPGGDVGGGGYSYGAQPGYKPEQMAGFYTPQANLQQAMINVHATPTGFRLKRGGIVSLLRLS